MAKASEKNLMISLASEITEITNWINDTENALKEFRNDKGQWEKNFSFMVGRRSGVGGNFFEMALLGPDRFPVNQSERLSNYYRKIVLEQLRGAKSYREELVRKMTEGL